MIAVIDNYDSFTWNLVQYICELGAEVSVFRNDVITVRDLALLNPAGLVISPGPGGPDDCPPFFVPLPDTFRICAERLRRCQVLCTEFLPDTGLGIAKSRHPALGRHARPGQHHDMARLAQPG